jgi:REP element-mobilizing transposase RayT
MSKTFTQLYAQIIFSVVYRKKLLDDSFREIIHKYITGIIANRNQKLLAINSVEDHIHILLGFKPSCCLSDLVKEIKTGSTNFINKKNFTNVPFKWQEGYGAFSYSKSQIGSVAGYIENQKQHHKIKTLEEEFIEFLDKFEIEYDPIYVFDFESNK